MALRARSSKKGVAEYWSFRFEGDPNWAIFTVNSHTGEFSIQSDWGNYSHRWSPNPGVLGAPTLKDFLLKTNPHYIVDKLSYNEGPQFKRQLDEYATREAIKEVLMEQSDERGDGGLYGENIWEELESLDFSNPDSLDRTLEDTTFLKEQVPMWELVDLFVYRPSTRYTFLVEEMIPFFLNHLKWEKENM